MHLLTTEKKIQLEFMNDAQSLLDLRVVWVSYVETFATFLFNTYYGYIERKSLGDFFIFCI